MLYANYVRNKMRHLYKPIIAEAEGVPCVLEYSKGKYMKNYEIYGNSIQNGTPSPDNPVEIQSVGDLVTDEASEYYGKYDIPITVAGKNLFDMETILPEQGWVKQDDGSYYVENASTPFKCWHPFLIYNFLPLESSYEFNIVAWVVVYLSSEQYSIPPTASTHKLICKKLNENQKYVNLNKYDPSTINAGRKIIRVNLFSGEKLFYYLDDLV